jgi:hypothetical protein
MIDPRIVGSPNLPSFVTAQARARGRLHALIGRLSGMSHNGETRRSATVILYGTNDALNGLSLARRVFSPRRMRATLSASTGGTRRMLSAAASSPQTVYYATMSVGLRATGRETL